MPVVLKAVMFGAAWRERQDGIETIQGLNGGLLIDTEHGRVLGRVQIEAEDVGRFGFEIGIIAGHVAFEAVRFQAGFLPNPMHGVFADAQCGSQLTATPVCAHWSCRKLAIALGVSKDAVHRVWQEAGLKPHRLERYMASDDPEFESKTADILGLYLQPPQHAAVFCVDEKTAIQALDRLDPVLPLSPGRAERHGFEYYRHGTLSLYAALNTATGRVHGKTAARHTSHEFVTFLQEVLSLCPPRQQIHIILDNLSAHKTRAVREFLQQHPRVRFHFTPTYSSWLNQVEIWFAKIEREVIARGIFTSVSDLARKLRRYINAYSANARPIRWKYSDPTRRVRSNEFTATGH